MTPPTTTPAPPALSLRGLTKGYRGASGWHTVLADVDLDVADGEFLAIVGFSGSGKTTLISAIAGLVDIDAGEVRVGGAPCRGPGRDRAVVFQSYSLMPWLSVTGNVALAVDAVHAEASRGERAALRDGTTELVGLGHAAARKTAQLSGGMRQRVAVARALAMKPDVLLLDEPLSALDALTRAKLQDEIERIRAQERRTIVMVTNDVDEALLLADRVAVLERGPGAKIAATFAVDLERPRDRAAVNHDPAFKALRNTIVACLDDLNRGGAPRVAADVPAAPVVAADADPSYLDFAGLVKAYPTPTGTLTVVDGFDLTVRQGEFVSLIGHSGCGKSTVLSMAAGLNAVTAGTITLAGEPVTGPGPDKAMVFQSPSLMPWLTARENVAIGVERVHRTMPRAQRRELVEHYLARVGPGDAADKKASALSNGMRQRVGLARAFALHPKLLLLDEPFGMLDSLTRWELQDALLDIWRRSQVTTVCVTHDVDEAILLADRVVMMTNGPHARIGRILPIELPRPRLRRAVLEDPAFYAYREEILAFLKEHDSGGANAA